MLWITTGIIISYIIGSIPTAFIFGNLLKGIDIRNFGSGNIGATNAFRVLGKGAGFLVLILDALKGFIAVVFVGSLVVSNSGLFREEIQRIILGISCICGHNWTIFLKFKGGKGIATSLGVLIGLSLKIAGLKYMLILTILTWFLIFAITRIVSISSVVAAISLPVYAVILKQSNALKYLSILLGCFVVLRHKSNLKRLLQGKEPRLSFKKS
jgi:glycerol-3-phosphate acyltransferase PlsY